MVTREQRELLKGVRKAAEKSGVKLEPVRAEPTRIEPAIVPYVSAVQYEPVDTGKKYSVLSLESYRITTGMASRTFSDGDVIAYCKDSPVEVLERLFQDYHVTCFINHQFFGSDDLTSSNPMQGLRIYGDDKFFTVPGIKITGDLSLLTSSGIFESVRRKRPVSSTLAKRILAHVTKNENRLELKRSPRFPQWQYEVAQIKQVLANYL